MREGYRVVTTTYSFVPTLTEAKQKALEGRGEGKRTEIITEDDYQLNYMTPMQDLTNIKENILLAKIDQYEQVLREIGLPAHVPEGFAPFEWWKYLASKHSEIARDVLGVTADDLIREQLKIDHANPDG